MSSSILLVLLLCATIMGQISAHLNATVGGSVLIPCSIPVNSSSITWFYWQEDKSNNILFHWHIDNKTQTVAEGYRNRCQALNTEFSSGNISIRLNNVSVGDDNKTFWANVDVNDEQGESSLPHQCKSSLQVSAPYQDLVLTINNTANSATCTAHGGFPEAGVSWTGQNKSSDAQLDLQDVNTSVKRNQTNKTFFVTSTVSTKELRSVTCLVYNPRSNHSINNTKVIEAPGEDQPRVRYAIIVPLIAAILSSVFLCLKCQEPNQRPQPAGNPPDAAADDNEAERIAPDASSNSLGDYVENNISLDVQAGACHFTVRQDAANSVSNKDTAAAAAAAIDEDAEEKTNLLSDNKEDSDDKTNK